MNRWLKEPLLHFLLLGALIFAVYGRLSPDGLAEGEIRVTRGQQEHLITAFTRTWRRPPTQDEFNHLVDDWVREEIAYRQGQEMGLDTDDTIIRRRLRQKLEMLAEDVVSLAEPTEAELQAYLEDNQDDYRREPRYTIRQVYFSRDRRGEEARRDAEQALVLLNTGDPLVDPAQAGDPLPLPHRLVSERRSALTAQFGTLFTDGLAGLESGAWHGPVESGFGLHLVFIEELTPGRPLTLVEAADEVRRDWANERRIETIDTLYERLRERYTVTVDPLNGSAAGAEASSP
jgi:hypothetical protein